MTGLSDTLCYKLKKKRPPKGSFDARTVLPEKPAWCENIYLNVLCNS